MSVCVHESVRERVPECAAFSFSQVAVAGLFWGRNCWWRAANIRDYVLKGKGLELQCESF